MSLDLPAHGDLTWDVKLNAALTQLNTQDAAEATARASADAAEVTARNAAIATASATSELFVVHGSTAGTGRPASTGPVLWVGSVTPTNAIVGDTWRDTTTDPYTSKIKGTGGFVVSGGSSSPTLLVKTTSYGMSVGDGVVVANGTSLTITLPSAVSAGATGTPRVVKNVNSSSATLASAAGTIDGATTQTLPQNSSYTVVSDGTNWQVV